MSSYVIANTALKKLLTNGWWALKLIWSTNRAVTIGLTGVALGTLIPTTAECLGFVLPYAMRVVGVSISEAFKQIFLPAMIPAVSNDNLALRHAPSSGTGVAALYHVCGKCRGVSLYGRIFQHGCE